MDFKQFLRAISAKDAFVRGAQRRRRDVLPIALALAFRHDDVYYFRASQGTSQFLTFHLT
jgi:hypothetical protein